MCMLPQGSGGMCFCKRKLNLSCNVGMVTFCKNHDALRAGRPAEIYLMNLDLSSGRKAIAYTDLLCAVVIYFPWEIPITSQLYRLIAMLKTPPT